MVFFLISNVLIHILNLRMGIGKCTVSFLPREFSLQEFLFVDGIPPTNPIFSKSVSAFTFGQKSHEDN